MTVDEALEVTRIYSGADPLSPDEAFVCHRPFGTAHPTVSYADLISGRWSTPGEISLPYRHMLYLDELPEFGLWMLEMLYLPLADKPVAVSRSAGSLTDPANFI